MTQRQGLEGDALLDALESGEVRVAERRDDGTWRVDPHIKQGILRIFASSPLVERDGFVDKQAFPVRAFDTAQGVRLVPGGSAVRRGCFVAEGVVIMPPAYLNVGCHVGAGSMIDSHALVGSCAQVGERVHVSAAAQIGGVLEPVGSRPVIVEDDCLVGGQCGLYEGVLVRRGAVLAAGVVLTGSTPVFDLTRGLVLRGSAEAPLEIPERSVVIPGTRPLSNAWANAQGLSASCALIVKVRDESTDRSTALEEALRGRDQ